MIGTNCEICGIRPIQEDNMCLYCLSVSEENIERLTQRIEQEMVGDFCDKILFD